MAGPWDTIATLTAPVFGLLEVNDTQPSPGKAFCRRRSAVNPLEVNTKGYSIHPKVARHVSAGNREVDVEAVVDIYFVGADRDINGIAVG